MLIKTTLVPIPADGRVYHDGKVFQVKPAKNGERWPHKKLIGKVPRDAPDFKEENYILEDGTQLMIPNYNYSMEYKTEYAEYLKRVSGKKHDIALPPATISVGIYLLVLGVAIKLGIYQLLCELFTAYIANAIMDVAIYYIMFHQNDINEMAEKLNMQLMFSIAPHEKKYYTKLFTSYAIKYAADSMFGEHIVREFMRRWVQLRILAGLVQIYLSLDGTNFPCQSQNNSEAEFGHSKTGKNERIVGVMAAVEASGDSKGMPLAYIIYPGSRPDVSSSQELLAFFEGTGIKIRCLLADRGFSYDEVMALADILGMPFLMMLKTNYEAFTTMFNKYKDTIFWNEAYWIEGTSSLYGISETDIHIYSEKSQNPERTACVALFFDGTKASMTRAREKKKLNSELRKIRKELDRFNQSGTIEQVLLCDDKKATDDDAASKKLTDSDKVFAALNKAKIRVTKEHEDSIKLEYNSDEQKVSASVSRDALTRSFETAGYSCMASSLPKTAQEMSDEYMLRDASEKAFSAMKSEIGWEVAHTEGEASFHAKFFTCFVADIIRNDILRMFQRYEETYSCSIDTNVMIASFSRITYTRCGSGYTFSGQINLPQTRMLESLGITTEAIKDLGDLVDWRLNSRKLEKYRDEQRVLPFALEAKQPGKSAEDKAKPKGDPTQNSNGKNKPAKSNTKTEPVQTASKADSPDSEVKTETATEPAKSSIKAEPCQIASDADSSNSDMQADAAEPSQKSGEEQSHISQGKKTKKRKSKKAKNASEKSKNRRGRPPGRLNDATIQKMAAGEYPPPKEKKERLGMQYAKTLAQDKRDRELSEKTGIDIIGNPPPRPWSKSVRAAETRRRNKLRKEAEKKLRELTA